MVSIFCFFVIASLIGLSEGAALVDTTCSVSRDVLNCYTEFFNGVGMIADASFVSCFSAVNYGVNVGFTFVKDLTCGGYFTYNDISVKSITSGLGYLFPLKQLGFAYMEVGNRVGDGIAYFIKESGVDFFTDMRQMREDMLFIGQQIMSGYIGAYIDVNRGVDYCLAFGVPVVDLLLEDSFRFFCGVAAGYVEGYDKTNQGLDIFIMQGLLPALDYDWLAGVSYWVGVGLWHPILFIREIFLGVKLCMCDFSDFLGEPLTVAIARVGMVVNGMFCGYAELGDAVIVAVKNYGGQFLSFLNLAVFTPVERALFENNLGVKLVGGELIYYNFQDLLGINKIFDFAEVVCSFYDEFLHRCFVNFSDFKDYIRLNNIVQIKRHGDFLSIFSQKEFLADERLYFYTLKQRVLAWFYYFWDEILCGVPGEYNVNEIAVRAGNHDVGVSARKEFFIDIIWQRAYFCAVKENFYNWLHYFGDDVFCATYSEHRFNVTRVFENEIEVSFMVSSILVLSLVVRAYFYGVYGL